MRPPPVPATVRDAGDHPSVPTELLRTLVRAALASNDAMNLAEVRIRSTSGSDERWDACLRSLATHRLLPIAGYAIERCGVDMVPDGPRQRLLTAYRDSLLTNTGFLRTLDHALRAMHAQSIRPVVRGGIVFAERLYPTIGARAVRNIDFAVPPGAMDVATAALESIGLRRNEPTTPDVARTFGDAADTSPTPRPRVRLTPVVVPDEDREEIETIHMRADTMSVLEPNACVVHLVRGMDTRRAETGYLLSSMLDLAFLFRERSTAISEPRLIELAGDDETVMSVARAARFLEVHFGVPTPAGLADRAQRTITFTLDDLIVAGRILPWELSTLGGWLRLGASRLAGRRTDHEMPQLSDLWRWPGLVRRERRRRSDTISDERAA